MRMRILPPTQIGDFFDFVLGLDEADFEKLLLGVQQRPNFALERDDAVNLAESLSIPLRNLAFLIGTLQFLQSNVSAAIQGNNISTEEAIERILEESEYRKENSRDEDLRIITRRVNSLLDTSGDVEKFLKLQRLKDGFIDSALSFSTLVDLRPYFSENSDSFPDEIKGLIPVIQLRIETNSLNSSTQELILNLTEETLEELRKTVNRAVSKIDLAKRYIVERGLGV